MENFWSWLLVIAVIAVILYAGYYNSVHQDDPGGYDRECYESLSPGEDMEVCNY